MTPRSSFSPDTNTTGGMRSARRTVGAPDPGTTTRSGTRTWCRGRRWTSRPATRIGRWCATYPSFSPRRDCASSGWRHGPSRHNRQSERLAKSEVDGPHMAEPDPLAGLGDLPWASVHHAYGPADDAPDQLRALHSRDEAIRGRA